LFSDSGAEQEVLQQSNTVFVERTTTGTKTAQKTSELSKCKNQVIPGQAAKQHNYCHYDIHVLLFLST